MAKQRRVIGPKEKAKVAIAAINEQKTARELSIQFKVHTTQIGVWKKRLLDEASGIFEGDYKGSRDQEFEQRESELFQEIGRLKIELEWLIKLPSPTDTLRSKASCSHCMRVFIAGHQKTRLHFCVIEWNMTQSTSAGWTATAMGPFDAPPIILAGQAMQEILRHAVFSIGVADQSHLRHPKAHAVSLAASAVLQ